MNKFSLAPRSFRAGGILLLLIGLGQPIFLLAQIDLEKRKIEFLLHEIEQLNGAKFWRNGTSYTPKEATEYLRMKMRWGDKGRPVKSARDFIERIGSKSSITGKPYLIQLPDGKKMEMKIFLDQKLSEWKE